MSHLIPRGISRGRVVFVFMERLRLAVPYRAPRPCRENGCPNYGIHRGWCEVHAKQHEHDYDQDRGWPSQRGYGEAWRQLRTDYLRAHPHCVSCGELATDVHHILPRNKGGTDDWSNLEALCHECHSRITLHNINDG